jgi:hypothetical protein
MEKTTKVLIVDGVDRDTEIALLAEAVNRGLTLNELLLEIIKEKLDGK